MLSTHTLLFPLLFTFLTAAFPILAQQADNMGPIRSVAAISHCGKPLQAHTLASRALVPNHTAVSLIVEDNLMNYLVRVGVGNPPRNYTLSIDTGSANVFVGGKLDYVTTNLSTNTTRPVGVSYSSFGFSGYEFFDTVTLGDCVMLNQSIGIPHTVSRMFRVDKVDGVLGIGPTRLTNGTLIDNVGQSIPTITDNLALGVIPSKTLALSFKPRNELNPLNGEITWGGIDPSKFVEPLIYVPITKMWPASRYMGIDASIFYDNKPLLSNGVGFIDSGESFLKLADDVLDAYTKAANVRKGTKYFSSISMKDYENLKPLVFVIGNSSFALTPDGQRFPPSVGQKYLMADPLTLIVPIGSTGNISGNGKDFILGMPWLRRFYVVYDSDNERVGVANTSYTNAIVN